MRIGRFRCWLGPFWSCFFFHWGRFGRGRYSLRGPFSTFIGAVLAMGRFGRFPSKQVMEENNKIVNMNMKMLLNANIELRFKSKLFSTKKSQNSLKVCLQGVFVKNALRVVRLQWQGKDDDSIGIRMILLLAFDCKCRFVRMRPNVIEKLTSSLCDLTLVMNLFKLTRAVLFQHLYLTSGLAEWRCEVVVSSASIQHRENGTVPDGWSPHCDAGFEESEKSSSDVHARAIRWRWGWSKCHALFWWPGENDSHLNLSPVLILTGLAG